MDNAQAIAFAAPACTAIITVGITMVTLMRPRGVQDVMESPNPGGMGQTLIGLNKLLESHQALEVSFARLTTQQIHQREQIEDLRAQVTKYHEEIKRVRDIYQAHVTQWAADERAKMGLDPKA